MKYEISIVTPFHNIDLNVFKNGVASMLNQTFGFENIQWIVVVHNSEPEYEQGVHNLLDGYDNVTVIELHNEKRTPSSPRNHGMKYAEGEYIGFLDGDDSFLPDCIERVIKYLRQEKPQIAWFRREYELESEDSVPLTEVVLWNQMKEKIIITKKNWQNEKMFTGLCGMVTSRVYNRQFLNEIGLQFDETVPFAEDFMFNLEAYGHAEKILYLPQLIGYHYFINSGSLVQSSKKNGKTLVEYAKGYKKVFDTGLKYGFYMNYIISFTCFFLARFMIDNDLLTKEDRITICNILKPYIESTTRLPINKIVSEKISEEYYNLPRDVILHPETEDFFGEKNALLSNKFSRSFGDSINQILFEILNDNSAADIGQLYNFSGIVSVEDYQNKVPLSSYDTYEILIHLTTRIGESRIFVCDPIPYYSAVWSSIGRKVIFPQTQKQVDASRMLLDNLVEGKTSFIMAESMPRVLKYNDNAVTNSVWGIILSSYLAKKSMYNSKSVFTSPDELLFPDKAEDTLYPRLLFALANPDVEQIIAPSAWCVLMALEYLKHNFAAFCDDIENGRLGKGCNMDAEIIEALNKKLKSDPERASYLRAVVKEGIDGHILKKVWPKLTKIVAEGSGSYALYKNKIKKYAADITIENGYLIRDVGAIGKGIGESDQYELLTKYAYYEFADVYGTVHTIHDLKENEEYELIITNRSGLYRFCTKEIIRICSVDDTKVIFCSVRHGNYGIKLQSSLLSEDKVRDAVLALEIEKNINVADFAFADLSTLTADDSIQPVIFLEASIEPEQERKLRETDRAEITEFLNSYLMNSVPDYREYAESGRLKLTVRIANPQINFMYCELQRYKNNLVQDQITPLKYLDNPKRIKFCLNDSD